MNLTVIKYYNNQMYTVVIVEAPAKTKKHAIGKLSAEIWNMLKQKLL